MWIWQAAIRTSRPSRHSGISQRNMVWKREQRLGWSWTMTWLFRASARERPHWPDENLTGIVSGLINGFLGTKIGINPFVTTLGTQTSVRGLVYIITGAKPITGGPKAFNIISMGKIAGVIHVPALIGLVLALVMAYILRKTRFGQYIYATGGNKRAAWLTGVNVDVIKTLVLVISGLFAPSGALVYTLRILMCAGDGMDGYELKVMLTCIVGGTSLDGGVGSIGGCIIGTMIMGILIMIIKRFAVDATIFNDHFYSDIPKRIHVRQFQKICFDRLLCKSWHDSYSFFKSLFLPIPLPFWKAMTCPPNSFVKMCFSSDFFADSAIISRFAARNPDLLLIFIRN